MVLPAQCAYGAPALPDPLLGGATVAQREQGQRVGWGEFGSEEGVFEQKQKGYRDIEDI